MRAGAIGLGGVLFIAIGGMSPLTGALGNIPYAVGFGNGSGAPAGFIVGLVIFLTFCVGYVAMTRRISSSGGLYSFVSHGLGRPLGMAVGWAAIGCYVLIEAAVLGAFAFFARTTIDDTFGIDITWPVLAAIALVGITILSHFDVRLGTKVLGVAMLAEVAILLIMDFAVLGQGGADGITLSPLNPVNAFEGPAPAIGIFFAVYCWVGFEIIPNFAEEARDPIKTGSRALYITVISVGLFLGFTAWCVVLGWGVDSAESAAAEDPGNFFFAVTTEFAGGFTTDVMKWLIVTSTFACALAFHNTTMRYLYAIGREGVLHKALGTTHPRQRTPHIANVVTAVLAATLVSASVLLWAVNDDAHAIADFQTMPYVELYGWYGIIAVFLVLCNLTLCSAACIRYFRMPEQRAHPDIWRTLVAPALSICMMLGLLYLLWSNIATFGGDVTFVHIIPFLCLGWLAIGAAIALVLRSRNPEAYQRLGRLVAVGVDAEPKD